MLQKTFLFSSLFAFCIFVQANHGQKNCPFTSDCVCYDGHHNKYSKVDCQTIKLPDLKPPPPKYETERLSITGPYVTDLPAHYFCTFSSIDSLILKVQLTQQTTQQWDESAFDGVNIKQLTASNIAGLIPPPPVLRRIGGKLLGLAVTENSVPISLTDSIFDGIFPNLESLAIEGITVAKLEDHAFSGLEQNLKTLVLERVGLLDVPTTALLGLTKLVLLSLANNKISKIPPSFFSRFPSLETISISGNINLANDIETGSLDDLPSTVQTLFLSNVGFTRIPKRVFEKNPHLPKIDLSGNNIQTIRADDFQNGANLERLRLSANPISNIEMGSFRFFKRTTLIDLSSTRLTSIDLSMFAGINNEASVELKMESNKVLTTVTISSFDNVSIFMGVIS